MREVAFFAVGFLAGFMFLYVVVEHYLSRGLVDKLGELFDIKSENKDGRLDK